MVFESQSWMRPLRSLRAAPTSYGLALTRGQCPGLLQRRGPPLEGLVPSLSLRPRLWNRTLTPAPHSSGVPAGGLETQGHLRDKVVPPVLSCQSGGDYEPGKRGKEGNRRDRRQGDRPSSSVSEGICHFNDVIFLAWLLSVAARRDSCLPE